MLARSVFGRFLFVFGVVWGSWFAAVLLAAVLLATVLLAEESRPPPGAPPSPVTRQEVWQAVVADLRQRGLSEQQLPRVEDLELPVALAAVAGRTVRVSSACWDAGPRRTQFRLECGGPGQCLPFLVYLHDGVREDVRNNDSRNDGNADAAVRVRPCRVRSGLRPALDPRLAKEAAPQPTLRTGDRATAVFLLDHLRMAASVTCLERGREGEVIRVRGPDGHVFRARISGPALLEALPQ